MIGKGENHLPSEVTGKREKSNFRKITGSHQQALYKNKIQYGRSIYYAACRLCFQGEMDRELSQKS
jgi:hypothetical protein